MVSNQFSADLILQATLQICGADLILHAGMIHERSVLTKLDPAPAHRLGRLREIASQLRDAIDAYEAAENAAGAEVVIVTPTAANVHPAVGGVQ